jgi:pseudaminic acid cytidylyltransferase
MTTDETHRCTVGSHSSSAKARAKRVAVIPARGGSKRLPGKNIRDFLGKPAIAYPIAAARQSRLFDRIVVSTDCSAIASTALALGAEVPFKRPGELARDQSGTLEVFQHALQYVDAQQDEPIAFACCIYPTAVLVTVNHLMRSFEALVASPGYEYCLTVCEFHHPVQRRLRIDNEGSVSAVHPEHSSARSQDFEPNYYDAGQFYWGAGMAIRAAVPPFTAKSLPYVLEPHEFVDINTDADWKLAEAIALGASAREKETNIRMRALRSATADR